MSAALLRLRISAAKMGVVLDTAALEGFEHYIDELLRWGPKLNLTGAKTAEDIVIPHLVDSLLPLAAWHFPSGGRVVDVGSGAGFPGVPVKLARPDLHVTLVETNRRRVAFLEHLQRVLGIDGLAVEWGRAEDLAHHASMRESFACSVERATARVPVAAEISLPFVAPGGAAILLTGPAALGDLSASVPLIEAVGGEVQDADPRVLPGGGRTPVVVVLRKVRPTPREFPRRPARLGQTPQAPECGGNR